MKQTITVEQAVIAYNALTKGSFAISPEGQEKIVKFYIAVEPVSDNYNRATESLTKKARANELDFEAFQAAVKAENERKITLEYDRLSEEDVKKLCNENTKAYVGKEYMTIRRVLAEESKPGKSDKA